MTKLQDLIEKKFGITSEYLTPVMVYWRSGSLVNSTSLQPSTNDALSAQRILTAFEEFDVIDGMYNIKHIDQDSVAVVGKMQAIQNAQDMYIKVDCDFLVNCHTRRDKGMKSFTPTRLTVEFEMCDFKDARAEAEAKAKAEAEAKAKAEAEAKAKEEAEKAKKEAEEKAKAEAEAKAKAEEESKRTAEESAKRIADCKTMLESLVAKKFDRAKIDAFLEKKGFTEDEIMEASL